ncbi:type I-E CRISPR-associated protein Cas7/Cse4/CasC [Solwaraspora sp. WMMD406]|uniref:type I-E CRISPR-associated protein Cas7/Cse4/CasC n=1 Tax=Solwaraspora sp. WMMD406 TaxID=3016095 RepID=UPI002416CDD3|nr:type I-E CRISPR-associated protein Cas7/Cse4/CasC [Solwaraspora sp. WMMD406]MDG4765924.1 type I-E CRISPR-associated protein Cas7/Cse4/CasC [Solwaraspora sp. WMMD406]
MTRTLIDIHILQTVPPSNLNRDDTGSPKTAIYGGKRRARVSSQAWKRATRNEFDKLLDRAELGERTKRLGESLGELIAAQAPDLAEQKLDLATKALTALGLVKAGKAKAGKSKSDDGTIPAAESDYLVFLSHRQLDAIAAHAVAAHRDGKEPDGKTLKKLANQEHSIDIALFGRMLADLSDVNVDAAVQVAHAISVHAVNNEFDYYTAVDDRKDDANEQGAGMIGTVEFNSSTLYRYATLDVDRLNDNLGDQTATRRAVDAFLTAFAKSMPTGKQNTFANRTLPDAVIVRLRDTQPINFVGAYEKVVEYDAATGRVSEAAERLADYAAAVEDTYGEQPIRAWVSRVGDHTKALDTLGDVVPFADLVTAVADEVAVRLGKE